MKHNVLKRITAAVTASLMIFSSTMIPAQAADPMITMKVSGTFHNADAEALLARINAIRLEAHNEGIVALEGNDDASYNPTNIANGTPLAWSSEAEKYAQIRAVESSVYWAHMRLDGVTPSIQYAPLSVTSGYQYPLENLAATSSVANAMDDTIFNHQYGWYDEKANYIQHMKFVAGTSTTDTTGVWGHYGAILCNSWKSVGVGAFTQSTSIYGLMNVTAEFSAIEPDNTFYTNPTAEVSIAASKLNAGAVTGSATCSTGSTEKYTASVTSNAFEPALASNGNPKPVLTLANPSWTSSDTSVATIDSTGTLTGIKAGTVTISYQDATTGTVLATKDVTIQAATITGVTAPAAISTPAGNDPTSKLPATVATTLSNGKTGTASVTWAAIPAANYGAGKAGTSFTVHGTIEGYAAGVDITVNVTDPTIVSVAAPAGITVASGTAPTLPSSLTATMSDST